MAVECDSCISPENEGFDVRWVRFPKHISLFSTLSQLESVGSWDSFNLVQRVVSELVVETTVVKLLRFYEVVLKLLWRSNSYPTGDHPDNR